MNPKPFEHHSQGEIKRVLYSTEYRASFFNCEGCQGQQFVKFPKTNAFPGTQPWKTHVMMCVKCDGISPCKTTGCKTLVKGSPVCKVHLIL